MPMVEVVGLIPVGKTFMIGYGFVTKETTEGYTWVLEKVRQMLGGVTPNAIVTDREQGLLEAVSLVFPDSRHLLCVWHIDMAVEKYALELHKSDWIAKKITSKWWHMVRTAATVDEHERRWANFCKKWGGMVGYVTRTWMIHVQKFDACYTNDVMHFGNIATSRVEYAHSVLKNWLNSATLNLDSIWTLVDAHIAQQHVEIRKLLEDSRSSSMSVEQPRLFSLLQGKVSHMAIRLMSGEFDRGTKLGMGLELGCGCAMVGTHGLLCACQLHHLYQQDQPVHLDDIHIFWRTLRYDDVNHMPADDDAQLSQMFDEIRGCNPVVRRLFVESIHSQLHPENEDVLEPEVLVNPRGRPRRASTRNLSGFEHSQRRHRSMTRSTPQTDAALGLTNFPSSPGAPLEMNWRVGDLSSFRYMYLIPAILEASFDRWYDPVGDGHCGFRVISHALRGTEDHYLMMREDLYAEICDPRYSLIYGVQEYENTTFPRIQFFSTPCGRDHWMVSYDLLAFATRFNWVIVLVTADQRNGRMSWTGSATYPPIRYRRDVTKPVGELWVLHTGAHFLRIHVEPDSPMPPLSVL
ncbi:hypothetical protein RND81_09G207300 [Saponaria officinalis]|uniref:MULE transposase domain-containing protein n=1 Tax=Saponaria officinalis TaxID=3572 RepID=A0AAW1IPJ8_SAPOF